MVRLLADENFNGDAIDGLRSRRAELDLVRIQDAGLTRTDDRVILLNEEDNDAAVKKISASDKPPEFGQGEIYGIARGSFNYEDGLWKTTINLKGDLCIYDASHPSGHFKKIVWKKGVGLVEYASGYGAHADGFRLKRQK